MCTNFLNVSIYFIKLSGVLLRDLLCFRAIVLHSTMRLVPMLDQLRKGLQLYDLLEVLKTHPDLCLPLFVPGEDDKVYTLVF